MTEPLNEHDIEDVLSSVRRVIAEKGTPRQTEPLGRLLLTPALRVNDPVAVPRPVQGEIVASSAPPPFQIEPEVYDRLAPIDEEVLQDLVRELMTEELQGPFGEKITRNIRKVIRAEIAREMAARDTRK